MKTSIWITGVGGFTGRYLVRFLRGLSADYPIIGFGKSRNDPGGLDSYYNVDINNTPQISALAKKTNPVKVIHLASAMPPAPDAAMWHVNVGGTISLLHALASMPDDTRRVVSIGSAAEYINSSGGVLTEKSKTGGASCYGRTKWAQTSLALFLGQQLKIKVSVARTFNLIGPGLSQNLVAGGLCTQFSKRGQEEIKIGNMNPYRDFVDVRDAVEAYWMIAQNDCPTGIYNVSSGKATQIKDLVALFSENSEIKHRVTSESSRLKDVDLDRVIGCNRKLRKATGWEPRISLVQSVRDMLEDGEP